LAEALDERFARSLNGSKILVIGMAYKKNVSDIRESPAFAVIELLQSRKAQVDFHDPHVDEVPPTREHAAFTGRRSVALTPASVATYDAVMIVTDHDAVDYGMVAQHAKLVVDTRNALATIEDRSKIVKA
jgi:UDP-N-acetyl-D-glucosamine dehydrogenase